MDLLLLAKIFFVIGIALVPLFYSITKPKEDLNKKKSEPLAHAM